MPYQVDAGISCNLSAVERDCVCEVSIAISNSGTNSEAALSTTTTSNYQLPIAASSASTTSTTHLHLHMRLVYLSDDDFTLISLNYLILKFPAIFTSPAVNNILTAHLIGSYTSTSSTSAANPCAPSSHWSNLLKSLRHDNVETCRRSTRRSTRSAATTGRSF